MADQPIPKRSTFADFIGTFGNGSLNDEMTAKFKDVAAAVQLLDKDGTITLTLKMSQKAGGMIVQPSIKVVAPEAKNNQFFFIDKDGMLVRRDPNQPQIPGIPAHLTNELD